MSGVALRIPEADGNWESPLARHGVEVDTVRLCSWEIYGWGYNILLHIHTINIYNHIYIQACAYILYNKLHTFHTHIFLCTRIFVLFFLYFIFVACMLLEPGRTQKPESQAKLMHTHFVGRDLTITTLAATNTATKKRTFEVAIFECRCLL